MRNLMRRVWNYRISEEEINSDGAIQSRQPRPGTQGRQSCRPHLRERRRRQAPPVTGVGVPATFLQA